MVSPLTTFAEEGVPNNSDAKANPVPVATSLNPNWPDLEVPHVSRFRLRRHSPPIFTLCLPLNQVNPSVVVSVICGLRYRTWLLRPRAVNPVTLISGTPS